MSDLPNVVNVDQVQPETSDHPRYTGSWKVLTPAMRQLGGTLGMVENRLPPGNSACPFHWHMHEDEIFYVLSGRGVLRYGQELVPLRPGDCVSCPAGTRIAHQIANTGEEDLVYLAIGPRHPHEVCGYPDSGKVMVRGLQTVGYLQGTDYMEGEPEDPRIFELAQEPRG